MKPRILIINDDGIEAPGLKHLWRALADVAELSIVAPAIEQSGVGAALTLRTPLHIEQVKWERDTPAWKVTGTPADCVRLATSVILDKAPDLIVSGINRGANSGRNVLYSGTVGGVIEGVLRNLPGIAFSCEDFQNPNYEIVEKHISPIMRYVLDNPLPKGTFLNINFPTRAIKGFRLARQGKGYWIEDIAARVSPEGKPYYWLGGKWDHHEEEIDSDVALLKEGYLTAVPIQVHELTDHNSLQNHRNAFERVFET